jgi:predicted RNA-binding protein with RPS1 domain
MVGLVGAVMLARDSPALAVSGRASGIQMQAVAEGEAAAEPSDEAEGAEPAKPATRPPRKNKTPIEELEIGSEIEGKIRSVMNYGAFVDFGAATDGLLHVSEICDEFVEDANDKLTAGDTVKGRIKSVNLEKGQVALSCKAPREPRKPRAPRGDVNEYANMDEKEFISGTVNSITDFGAFVSLKEGIDGLVHISQIQDGGVRTVEDVLSVGMPVKVRVLSVDAAKNRIALSMREWQEPSERDNRRGGGGFGGDAAFLVSKEERMSTEELEALTVGDEFSSVFDAAMTRAEEVKKVKSEKGKYKATVL